MGRGRMSSGGGGGRGFSSGGGSHWGGGHRHSTVVIGGNSSGSPWVAIVVGVLFALIGTIVMIVGIGRCCAVFDYAKVKAVAISNEYSQGYYYTHYNYTVKSNRYDNVRSNQGWQFEEVIGKTVEIYYLKDDPEEIYEERPVDVAEGGILTGFGLIFAVFGSLPIIIGVKALKNKKKGGSDDASSGTPQEYDVSCPYCGNKYKNTANRCPKCGASSRY